jgi:hypothetical protein
MERSVRAASYYSRSRGPPSDLRQADTKLSSRSCTSWKMSVWCGGYHCPDQLDGVGRWPWEPDWEFDSVLTLWCPGEQSDSIQDRSVTHQDPGEAGGAGEAGGRTSQTGRGSDTELVRVRPRPPFSPHRFIGLGSHVTASGSVTWLVSRQPG